jgi:hypothetical protein
MESPERYFRRMTTKRVFQNEGSLIISDASFSPAATQRAPASRLASERIVGLWFMSACQRQLEEC